MNIPKDSYILLVEDNIDDIDLTMLAFKKNKICNQIKVAMNAEQALELLHGDDHASEPLPTVVLMDINMPGMSGLEALKLIRKHPRTQLLPVVILTSSKEDQDIVEGYGSGANSYIRKPVDFNEFTQAVRQLGMYWLLLNEPAPN